ncbi:MAG: hypothetical protein M0Q46_01845 [Endomicrobiales bacterium]|nr:hypothetical protein [Endomicrobiales bacterium]
MQKIVSLENHIDKIRELVCEPRRSNALVKNTINWHQLCSCMDTLGDTESAICFYEEACFPEGGGKYIYIYGLLQVMVAQQNSVNDILVALDFSKISWKDEPSLFKIRDLRNRSIGHPTKTDKTPIVASHFISRPSLTKDGFQLMICEKGNSRFENVNIKELIATQREELSKKMSEIIKKLQEDDKTHKNKYAKEKLESIFERYGYCISKIFEAIGDEDTHCIATISLNEINDTLNIFMNKLKERGLEYNSVADIYNKIAYPLKELEMYFSVTHGINSETAYIFTTFINCKVKELKDIAIEIDNEYSEILKNKTQKK